MNKLPLRLGLLITSILALILFHPVASAQPTGQWDFENGNLAATVGADLQYTDGQGGATELATQFGTTTALGIPDIGGTPAKVMRFPASTTPMGFSMPTPANPNGEGSLVNDWTIMFDILFPAESDAKWRALMETDGRFLAPDADFFVNPGNGIGISGQYHGQVSANTWYRIGFVVEASKGIIRKYINGVLVGSQSAKSGATPALDGRWSLAPGSSAELFNDDDGEVAVGYVNSIQLRDVALSSPQMQAFGGPSAAGIPQAIPPIPSFVESWIPRGTIANRNTDIGAIIFQGDAVIPDNSIVLKLDGVAVTAPQITRAGGLITVRKANSPPFAPGSKHTLELTYNDSLAGSKTFNHAFTAAIFYEDFESVVLGPNVDEGLAGEMVWTDTPPAGWTVDDTGVPGYLDQTTDGVTEWAGWGFANRDWWASTAGDQRRTEFLKASGTVAIADPDEWDDVGHEIGLYNAIMTTPSISVAGIPAGTMFLKFESSWRDECCDDRAELDNDQTAVITASFDGGPEIEIMRWDSSPGDAFFHDDNPNETVVININNPAGANSVVLKFGLIKAENDWWWAVDNIELNGGAVAPIIASHPLPEIASLGGNVTFRVVASGTEPLNYQWRFNEQNIPGANGTSLTLNNVQFNQAGDYDVVVSNVADSVTSSKANLKVLANPIGKDLVTHLKFDDNFQDSSGRANHGEAFGIPAFAAGKIGPSAVQIPSGADYVTLGVPADLNFGTTTDFTIAFWTKVISLDGDPSLIGNKNWNSGSNPGHVMFTDDSGAFRWNIAGPPGTRKDATGPPGTLNDREWHHVVYAFERTGYARIYVDGVLGTATFIGANLNNLDTPEGFATNIGQDGTGTYGPHFNDASIDDLGIWRRALTSHEAAAIYQAGVGGTDLANSVKEVQISADPQGKTVVVGESVTLTVTASGTAPLLYQWLKGGAPIPGANSASYVISSAKESDSGTYSVEVSNMAGSKTSAGAVLLVQPPAGLETGLVVHLTFDSNLQDASGRNNHGTANGSTPLAPGKVGANAVKVSTRADTSSFNYVSLGAPADLNFGTDTDFTVAFWAKLNSWSGDPSFVSNKDWDSGGNQGWVIATDGDGRLQWNIADGTPGGRTRKDYDGPGGTFSDSNWHHITVVFVQSGNAMTYVDGVLVDTRAIAEGLDSVDTPAGFATNIGQDGTGSYSSSIDALIDDLGIWRRALTGAEVVSVYRKGQAGVNITQPHVTDGLVAHLKFDSDLKDSSGHNNHGTANGTTPLVAGKVGSNAVQVSTKAETSTFNFVTLGAPAALNFGTDQDFSVAFWAKLNSWSGDPAFLSNKDWDSGGNQGWVLATDGDGRLQWNIADGTPGGRTRKDYDGPGGTFSDSNWHHVTVVFVQSGDATTYVDGVRVDTRRIADGLDSVDTPAGFATNIGQDGTGSYGSPIDALIDDVGIWRRALAAEEVAAIYSSGQSGVDLARASLRPKISSVSLSGNNLVISWTGQPGLKLEKTSSLTNPSWQEVAGSNGSSSATVPVDGVAAFFRLAR
ncbi:MAG: LamG-like jellyroll fold domain-containing protein [Verrucomicrobiota bacterium]